MLCMHIKHASHVVGLTSALLVSGCVSNRLDLVKSGDIKLIIAEENADYIRHAQVVLDNDTTIVEVHVRRGVVGHIPHPYQGHADLSIEDETGSVLEVGTVRLKSKQEQFFYHINSKPFTTGVIKMSYFKVSHGSHLEVSE